MAVISSVTLMVASAGTLLIAGGLLYQADRRARATQGRISNIAAIHVQTIATKQDQRRGGAETTLKFGLLHEILSYAGVEQDRPDLYPLPWWLLLVMAVGLAAVLAVCGAFFVGSIAWLSLPLDTFLLVRSIFKFFRNRRSAKLYVQLPDALGMIVRSVRVGFTVSDALRIISEEGQSPTAGEFRRVVDEIKLGGLLQDALEKLADPSGLLEYRFLAVALALQKQSGGSLSETLENLADVVRKRVALKERGIALASEARTTMWILGALPFLVSGALAVLSPEYLAPLFTTSMGRKLLLVGILLLGLGFGSMRVIIKKSIS